MSDSKSDDPFPIRAVRQDHFAGMRTAEAKAPPAVPPKDAPPVSVELVEWLEREFRFHAPSIPRTLDQAVSVSSQIARATGHREVIDHLKSLLHANAATSGD